MWDDFTVFLLDNLRYSDWSACRRPDRIQTNLRRQAKERFYLHVAYQNLYHAGPENMQLIASVRYGKQISQCQDVSQSSRRKGERGGKQKTEVIFLASAENLPPMWHLVLVCLFLKVYRLKRSSDA